MFNRQIEHRIKAAFDLNKVVVLLGARRVGKTTLVKEIINDFPDSRYINCELLENSELLQTTNSEKFFFVYKFLQIFSF